MMKHHPGSACAARRGDGQHGPHGGRPGPRDDVMRGRKFSSDELQLMLLALLEAKSSHGYELIRALELRSEGVYTPSPGMVYPALTYLEELGLAQVAQDGNKKSYSLSAEGRAHLETWRARAGELFAGLAHLARKMNYMRGAMAEEADGGAWLPLFVDARIGLKRALLAKSASNHDEQRRVAAILLRATDEINQVTAQAPAQTPAPGAA